MSEETSLISEYVCLFVSEERVVESEMSSCEWCFPESTAHFEDVPLQYKGFCGFTLVKNNGLLLPGTNSETVCIAFDICFL